MKKLIALLLSLIIIPFLITSKKSIDEEVNKISRENLKNPDTSHWEYIKEILAKEPSIVDKKYNMPIYIKLIGASPKDSLAVVDFIERIKVIVPNLKISLKIDRETIPKHKYIKLYFRKKLDASKNVRYETNFQNNSVVYSMQPKVSSFSPEGKEIKIYYNISEKDEKLFGKSYLKYELFQNIFPRKYSKEEFRKILSGEKNLILNKDRFFLKKVTSDNFETEFDNYLYNNYPWRYAYSFFNRKKIETLAIGAATAVGLFFFVLMYSFLQNKSFKYIYFDYLIPVTLIIISIFILVFIYQYLTVFSFFLTWNAQAILFVLVIALFVSTVLFLLEKFLLKKTIYFTLLLILKVVFTFIAFNLPILIFIYVFDENGLSLSFEFIIDYLEIFMVTGVLSLGRGLLLYLNHFSESLVKEKDVELSRLKEVNAQSELKLLQSHINPHFLYNALNSIAGLVHKSPDKSEKMALSLSNLFRYSINKKGQQMSTVNEEVLMVQNYLEIENIRFGDRLTFTLKIDEALKNEEIPMYMLQPLVENAIKHGISKIRDAGVIVLEIKKEEDNLLIRVSDSGPDFPNGLVSGHGLQTVYDLLRLSYGDKASLKWENTPEKRIEVKLPLKA